MKLPQVMYSSQPGLDDFASQKGIQSRTVAHDAFPDHLVDWRARLNAMVLPCCMHRHEEVTGQHVEHENREAERFH